MCGFALRFCAYALALHFTSLLAACCCLLQNNTQLGFFFFKKEDAEAIIAKVRQPGQPVGKLLRTKRVKGPYKQAHVTAVAAPL
jgi:hypothetical protein